MIPSDSAAFVGGGGSDLELEGVGVEDEYLPSDLRLRVNDPDGGTTTLRVIGVVDRSAEYLGDVVTSTDGLARVTDDEDARPTAWFLTADDRDEAGELEIAAQRALMDHAVTTTPLKGEVELSAESNGAVQWLLMAFMGFGLVVGCAALGVVTIRSIAERRNQIGVLRAIGMQRSGVRRLFLIESLLVTVSGIVLGFGLAFIVSPGLIDSLRVDLPGVTYTVPTTVLAWIIGITLVFSTVISVLMSRRAGEVPLCRAPGILSCSPRSPQDRSSKPPANFPPVRRTNHEIASGTPIRPVHRRRLSVQQGPRRDQGSGLVRAREGDRQRRALPEPRHQ
ncbi:ABC transporter permease [Nocardiopsis xinjiangensis]|uniref:ABC transporter permease n=1 Tax=Nocardiopsis xinjiangensis TaxID=124285 RepID=UPI0003496E2F|nr:ABC transporter permease [Nocardiopsis xinjiangensis]